MGEVLGNAKEMLRDLMPLPRWRSGDLGGVGTAPVQSEGVEVPEGIRVRWYGELPITLPSTLDENAGEYGAVIP